MAHTKDEETMFLYVGAYKDMKSAEEDYDALLALHKEGWVGDYDVGIVAKNEAGKLDIKRHTNSTGKGTRRGLAVGVLAGVIFPPSILASGLIGLGAGAAIGHHFNDISRDDLRAIGDYMEDNEAALVVVGESQVAEMVSKAAKSAIKDYKKEFDANVKDYDKQLNRAIHAA
jgi:uncharacterized membrane protein